MTVVNLTRRSDSESGSTIRPLGAKSCLLLEGGYLEEADRDFQTWAKRRECKSVNPRSRQTERMANQARAYFPRRQVIGWKFILLLHLFNPSRLLTECFGSIAISYNLDSSVWARTT